jgi:hypothetical protein
MSRAAWIIAFIPLVGCITDYDQGFEDGCRFGEIEGARYAGIDAALCSKPDDTPPDLWGEPTDYDDGYADGFYTCFPDSYWDSWRDSNAYLDETVGACEEDAPADQP